MIGPVAAIRLREMKNRIRCEADLYMVIGETRKDTN